MTNPDPFQAEQSRLGAEVTRLAAELDTASKHAVDLHDRNGADDPDYEAARVNAVAISQAYEAARIAQREHAGLES